MKRLIIIILFLMQGGWAFAQQEKSFLHKGNELYQQKKYNEAEQQYRKALEKKAQNVEGNFNVGDAMFKQKKFDEAGQQFGKLAEGTKDKKVAAAAYHNLGNTLMEGKKLEESIEAYKKALMNNPKDEETRYNLAYAQEKLKKQQQQNKNDKNKDKNKDKDKDKKDQDKKDKDKKDQDKKDKDKQDKDKQDKDKQDQQKQQQQQQKPQVSKEDAQRMLDALNNNEKQTQDKLKNKKLKGAPVKIAKDW
ncbi:tetratricopeptide repeat protein [Mucilaginibacter mali]|uniref:Tetratricopeptide repeat protein n=1 Tax=Mucilaginibacter mali TaxID=2740462 RepID=A0A7D4PZ64_9SPHI|nr:tetratricopeptide repeat protein [Mucilaginibacter mali]QKJ28686.1 tetratricopeptide repeat protein [Mucilaginibacter mali]